ncbi:uncharacterized protein LOC142329257 [Lycorma delicatula]|uniref:uncharacterized protein LOC142329257 n=1 Tax=Lycorma delicatula TaxID=130591 RepID=UPI003F51A092
MSGYRRVNYYELCRLCTSSEGTKIHIFREEGRRRQLPTKIQVCLPLQVCEDDSLPKIICTHCADKLEGFYDFRETCINAENMLEGYFSTLRHSEEFIREGKVYVKDEPVKKKVSHTESKLLEHNQNHGQIKIATVTPVPVVQPVTVETLPAIQIVSQGDTETDFKDQIEVDQSVAVTDSIIETRYTYQNCNTSENNNNSDHHNNNNTSDSNTTAALIAQAEDATQTDFSDPKSVIKDDSTQQLSVTSSDGGDNESSIHQDITLEQSQEMLVQFGFGKDKDNSAAAAALFRAEDALQRSSIAQIGEFLRMKTVTMVESFTDPDGLHIAMCDSCGQELSSAEELANHVGNCKASIDSNQSSANGMDDKTNSISCDICGKPFKRKEHLFQHRKLHTGERPYTCSTCMKSFSRKEHLVRHSVSHTGQKMHSCDMCGKSFSRKDNLHKHRKTHGIAGPYICDVCGKSFVVRHYYQIHKATHTPTDSPDDTLPYRCDICNKGFMVKQYLITHRSRHRNRNAATNNNMPSNNEQNNSSEPSGLTTVNTAAILPPNVLHSGSTTSSTVPTPVFQVAATSGATTYVCTPDSATTNQIIETYRRLNQTT